MNEEELTQFMQDQRDMFANEARRLRAENEKLRAALKPFAAINFNACLEDADSGQLWGWFFKEDVSAAAAALKGMGNV